jgi:hypothetical protein
MGLGELFIPKIEIEPFAFSHDFQTRVYLQYADLVKKTEIGRTIVQKLTEDQRVIDLNGKMISRGSGAHRFEIETLAMWYLLHANEFGAEVAEKHLDSFLDSECIDVVNTLWVLGIEVEEKIELDDGYVIQSVEDMPDSRDKEHFFQRRFDHTVQPTPLPTGAITKSCQVKKTQPDDPAALMDENADFWNAGRRLYEISLLLNALPGISCLPYYSTSYPYPETPFGPFGGSGGGSSLYDVLGHSSTRLSNEDRADINVLIKHYIRLDESERARIQRILNRLSQAKRRTQIEDKILDLGIAMEMLLLEDNRNNDQLSLSFRLRGSWMLGTSPEKRVEIYDQLKEIYNYRSQVAHSGVLCKGNVAKIQNVQNAFPKYQSHAESVCRKIIEGGKPDWNKIILDVI